MSEPAERLDSDFNRIFDDQKTLEWGDYEKEHMDYLSEYKYGRTSSDGYEFFRDALEKLKEKQK